MVPATLNEKTLAKEMLDELDAAIALLADDVVCECGQTKRRHRPARRLKIECVLVQKYGVLWRRVFCRGKWQRVEQIVGSIDD